MNMNMQSLMRQAQKIQKDLEKSQKELSETTYEGSSSLVNVVINGNKNIVSVKIKSNDDFTSEDIEMLEDMLHKRHLLHMASTLEEFMCGLSNKKLGLWAIKKAGFKGHEMIKEMSFEQLYALVYRLKNMEFHITDTKGYDTAQVTAGGVLLSELDENMQSKFVSGLYFVGEIVDVDGICGGFNLQWAFASGYVAGCDCITKKDI